MTPLWAVELAQQFWHEVGYAEPFPRRLREPLDASPFLVTVEALPHLTTKEVARFLAEQGCPRTWAGKDRALCGCLVADNGTAWLFLDANDDPDEQTATLAHELAHFLRDYWQPRQRAVAALGPDVLEVLDGRRAARPAERLHAVLRNTPLGCHVHLMTRHAEYQEPTVRAAEEAADTLALELLAPADVVMDRYATLPGEGVRTVLQRDFGLTPAFAARYAPAAEPAPLLARLRRAQKSCRTSPPAREG